MKHVPIFKFLTSYDTFSLAIIKLNHQLRHKGPLQSQVK